ncbi:hypothetical protein BCR33DRAFT_850552 [Rhizoclosmatium globosum]|uniref:Cell morphogenesis protein N-terminal domain-containing protein n=1 Tax=Rhizoclosmatium globosum TaxID=329046 RepID=A0A1Y2CBP5_9FUNG|nr:hypothetical protein BCR33DRAFT_850552 [Rhizoclosmatium globosum]|eukprot:ORY44459.1 hypothetical protein BCR33DRAFT_850552 [Rhizoclosmatium globosum]
MFHSTNNLAAPQKSLGRHGRSESTSFELPTTTPTVVLPKESKSASDVADSSAMHHHIQITQKNSLLHPIQAAAIPLALSQPETPAEATLRQLFTRFVELAEAKLLQLVYSHGGDMTIDLSLALRPGVDAEFDGVLRGLGAVATHCQKDLIEGLMAWRTDKSNAQKNRVPTWVAPLYLLKEMEKIVYNRQMMVSNFILLRAWIEIVQNMTKDMLQDSLASKMEYVAFNQLRYENPELVATNPTCKAHIDLNAEFLGKLSNIRFAKVSDGFVKEISELSKPATIKDPNQQALKLDICIRAMRFLKLKIYPMDCLEETAEFLMIFAGFFVNTHNPKIKHAYCDLFVELLEPVVAVATAEVNLPTWKEGIELIFGKAMRMIQKKGHMQHSLPLVTTSLCLSRKEFFNQNIPAVIDICVQRLRDKQLKSQALVSLTRLLWVCAHRNSDASSAITAKRVESLLKHIFPPRSTLINPPDVALDLLTRMVYIAMVKYMETMMELFSILMLGIDITVNAGSGSIAGGATITGSLGSDRHNYNSGTSGATKRSDFSASSGVPDSIFTAWSSGVSQDEVLVAAASSGAGPKRQIIGMRAFLMLLTDIEEALEMSSSSGGQNGSPWSNGFGGSSLTAGSSTARSVLVQGKIKLLPPPFPSLNLSERGDMALWHHRIEASWLSGSSSPVLQSEAQIAVKAANLGSAISNATLQRMSSNVRVYLERVNIIFGSMIMALDKVCGNHFWSSQRDTGYISLGGSAANMSDNSRRNSGDPSGLGAGVGGSGGNAIPNMSGTTMADSNATSILGMNKWAQYELLRNCIDCIPKLSPINISANRVVEMLTLYTFHVDEHVRTSSIQAILRISKIVQAEATVRVVCDTMQSLLLERATDALYYVDFDDSMMEQTAVWLVWKLTDICFKEFMNSKTTDVEVADVENFMCDTENRGLLYLCSTNPAVRRLGVKILEIGRSTEALLTEKFRLDFSYVPKDSKRKKKFTKVFDNLPLNERNTRILSIIEAANGPLMNAYFMESVVVDNSERSRQKERQRLNYLVSRKDSLLLLAVSDIQEEGFLWDRCFPDLCQYFFTYAHPHVLLRLVSTVTNRLHFLNSSIIASDFTVSQPGSVMPSQPLQSSTAISMEPHHVANLSKVFGISAAVEVQTAEAQVIPTVATLVNSGAHISPVSDNVLTQWRVYLKLACACIEIVDEESVAGGTSSLKPVVLFRMVVAYFLWNDLRSENLPFYMKNATGPKKLTNLSSGQGGSAVSSKRSERFRVELTHVLSLLTDFLEYDIYRNNEAIFKPVYTYIFETTKFLADSDVQSDWDYHMLRYHFCTLVEKFYSHILSTVCRVYSDVGEFAPDMDMSMVSKLFPFELRRKAFILLETWCGFGRQSSSHLELQSKSMIKSLEAIVARDHHRDPSKVAETMNKQRVTLQLAALKAMAALVHGPMSEPSSRSDFSISDLHHWINDLYNTQNEDFHRIASVATQGLLVYNGYSEDLMNIVLRECYISSDTNIGGSIGYFKAIVQVYAGVVDDIANLNIIRGAHPDYPCAAPRLIALSLFKAGDPDPDIRSELCVSFELLNSPSSVYKRAQVLTSTILATERPTITTFIVSELCLRIEQVSSREGIRDILAFMIPWIRNLQLAATHQPRTTSKVENPFLDADADSPLRRTENFLTNLFYITVCFGDDFSIEVEAIWIHLLRRTNVKAVNDLYLNSVWPEEIVTTHLETVLDFVLALGVSRRNPVFIYHSKKVISYLRRVVGCDLLIRSLMLRLNPINFTPMDNVPVKIGESQASVPYCIDINTILPETVSRPPLTFGGLVSTFLVELILQAKPETTHRIIPYMIHIIFIQLDHFISLICEQMKTLLIRLLQNLPNELVDRSAVNSIVTKVAEKEDRRLWPYEDISPERQEIESTIHISRLVTDVLSVFSKVYPELVDQWTATALFFGVNCPVRHAACRSLQILRALKGNFSTKVFGEMFLRYSTTAADRLVDIQSYSLEILITVNSIINDIPSAQIMEIPQLFWAGVSILTSPLEAEFMKGAEILLSVITKTNFSSKETQSAIQAAKPSKWKGNFVGIQPLLVKGLQSKKSERIVLALINNFLSISDPTLIDTTPFRLATSVLANFPRFMYGFESDTASSEGASIQYKLAESISAAENLSKLAELHNQPSLSRLMYSFSKQRFRSMEDFLQQFGYAVRDIFLPTQDACVVLILTTLLSNKLLFYRKWSLQLMKMIIPCLHPDANGTFQAFTLIDTDMDLVLPCVEALKSESREIAAAVLQELLQNSGSNVNERFLRRNYGKISQESFDRVITLMETGDAKTSESKTGWKISGDVTRAAKVTRYNVASVVATCGINTISTQLSCLKEFSSIRPDWKEDTRGSVISYRIPPKPTAKVLLSDENKAKLLKSLEILDDIFKDNEPEVPAVLSLDSNIDPPVKVTVSSSDDHLLGGQQPDNDHTAFKHILCQSNVGIQIVFKVLEPFELFTSNETFSKRLVEDLTRSLVAEEGTVLINRIVNAGANDPSIVGTIVTVDLSGGGLLGNGKVAAAQAEDLRALILQNEDLPERKLLWEGAVSSKIDPAFEPTIVINFKGMAILTLCHNTDISEASFVVSNNYELEKTHDKGVETLRIFPAAFELVIQLHADLIALIDDMNVASANNDERLRFVFSKLMESVLSVRHNSRGYCPALLQLAEQDGVVAVVTNKEALYEAGHKLMQLEASKLSVFLTKREQHVQSINSQISSYLSSRRQIGSDFSSIVSDFKSLKCVISLAVSLMSLHGIILALEGVYDDFMLPTDSNNQARLDESLRCVQARAALRELLSFE